MKSFFALIDSIPRTRRYLISFAVGFTVMLCTWRNSTPAYVFMLSWIGFAATVLFFAWSTILIKHPKEISTVAVEQDSSYLLIFTFVVFAAFASVFAIILLLHGLPTNSRRGIDIHIILSVIAVALSWILIHTLFTIRYAHFYYNSPPDPDQDTTQTDKGLIFPGTELPDFLDFAYFSFVLGMTFQVADVSISGRVIRRLALLHGFLSFIYNTAIIALSINIISGLIGK